MAPSLTAALRAAAARRDRDGVLRHLAGYPIATFPAGARDDAAAAIVALKAPFAQDRVVCGAALCALFHVCGGVLVPPLAAALDLAMAHFEHAPLVCALLRLLSLHVHGAPFLNGVPRLAKIVSSLMCAHRHDEAVSFYGAGVLMHLLAIDAQAVHDAYGAFGQEDLRLACVAAASVAVHGAVQVNAQTWHAHVLATLAPRLRTR